MRLFRFAFLFLFTYPIIVRAQSSVLSAPVDAKDSRQAAVAKYPQLAIASSPLNSLFVQEYKGLVVANDPHLQQPDWPVWLADRCAAELRRRNVISHPSPTPHVPAAMGQTALDQPATTVDSGQ